MVKTQKHQVGTHIGRHIVTGLLCLLILIGYLCFFSGRWYVRVYGRIGFDSVLYTLTASLGGVQKGLISDYLLTGALPALLQRSNRAVAVLSLEETPLLEALAVYHGEHRPQPQPDHLCRL